MEQPTDTAAIHLRPIQSEIGLLQQFVAIDAVLRGEGDADAGADHDLVAGHLEQRVEHLDQPVGEPGRLGRPVDRLDDGKFVAAKPRHDVRLARALHQPHRHRPQQQIADRMTERVVHRLELVEVKAQQRKAFTAPRGSQRVLQSLAEQHTVRQIGQRVMMREMRHSCFGPAALCDVLERGKPAVVHRLVGHVEYPPAGKLPDGGNPLVAGDQSRAASAHVLHVFGGDLTCLDDTIGHLAVCHARHQRAVRHAEHAIHALVRHHQSPCMIKHQQGLQHVVQCDIEALSLQLQGHGATLVLLGARLRGLGRLEQLVATQMADREQNRDGQDKLEEDGHHAQCGSLLAPGLEDFIDGTARGDDQRVVGDGVPGNQPLLVIQRTGEPGDAAIQRAEHAIIVPSLAERLADLRDHLRVANQQHAVAAIQRERRLTVQRDLGEQMFEMVGQHRAEDDPDQLSVR